VGWSVLAGLEARLVDDVVVSSDDQEILEEAIRCGARPLPRPAELATDEASTDAVLVHAMSVMGWHHDLVVLLQPTVPVRAPGLVDGCIRRIVETGGDSLLTAYRLHFVWRRDYRTRHNGEPASEAAPWIQANCRGLRIPRQQFAESDYRFHEDGSVYVTRARLLAEQRVRLGGKVEIYEAERSVDIDTEADLCVASSLLTSVA
jgi:N-acylneuraminate cytidylyltransferase